MKYLSTSLATLAFASFSIIAAPLPDPGKLPPVSKQTEVTFEKDIHPMFDTACVRCHGEQRPKAALRLDTIDGVLKGSKNGKVVVLNESGKSPLVFAVAEIDGKISMPPKPRPPRAPQAAADGSTNAPVAPPAPPAHPWKPLTPEQVGLVRAWIDQGAK